ncbi:MAG: hypothetical protein EZS28_034826 [Streblomastix strix]|uniref:Uncharacterized protein n=1 Tax=Streblomastix strix TaxID=222440 RepID=A0A5J4UGX0_9EUKA|nr:MAG: hypothetical protein EZS28_034826 [Streblomastix strix]
MLSFNANDQYTFTNNTFTNNSGYYAGAIYRPSGWSRDNYLSEVTKLLVGSKSSETNIIHYTIWSTSDVSQYENWYVDLAEQPPVVDPPIVDPPPVIQGICERKVNQTYTGSDNNTKQTVGDVLYQTCTGGYRITMVSQVHVEFVNVSKPQTAPVLIKGGAISGGREIRTTMTFKSYQPHTVLLDQGNLTLQNLEFNFTFLSNQSIYPALSLVGTSNSTSASYYKSLTIISCVLNGLGNISGAEFIIESSKFLNIKNYHIYGSGIDLQFGGQNQKITINQCIFQNISCNVTEQGTGALSLTSLKCTASQSSTVPQDSCTCTNTNYPYGCKCPTDSSQLTGIPSSRCECRLTSDPRASGICPAYCIEGSLINDCVCDSDSSQYPSSICSQDKLCQFDLEYQSQEDCPCLNTADPRAVFRGLSLPQYWRSKNGYNLQIS